MHVYLNSSIQEVVAFTSSGISIKRLPAPHKLVGAGPLVWGRAEEICSPAYWAAQSWMWILEEPDHYQLGSSLEEEVLACLLGGYGIPAEIGLAAYERLRFEISRDKRRLTDAEFVYNLLSQPMVLDGRKVRYRFARQKANYIAAVFSGLKKSWYKQNDRQLRDSLMELPGIGPKTASWIVRNWRGSDEVSILDVHILRAGKVLGIFPEKWRVDRHYNLLEDAYLEFARAIETRASILDSVMWMTMRRLSLAMIARLLSGTKRTPPRGVRASVPK